MLAQPYKLAEATAAKNKVFVFFIISSSISTASKKQKNLKFINFSEKIPEDLRKNSRKIYKLVLTDIFVKTITITKREYIALKKKAEVDTMLVEKLKRGFEDIKHGRIKEWKK